MYKIMKNFYRSDQAPYTHTLSPKIVVHRSHATVFPPGPGFPITAIKPVGGGT